MSPTPEKRLCPRTCHAQDESWAQYGTYHYMRMISAYSFCRQLEEEIAELRDLLTKRHGELESGGGIDGS